MSGVGDVLAAMPLHCPICGQLLPDRGAFCPSCASQVKCKSCKALLERCATACVECGSLVSQSQAMQADFAVPVAQAPNVLRLEETRTSRSFEARFTDDAVESLSLPLSAYFGASVYESRQRHARSNRPLGGVAIEQLPLLPEIEAEVVVASPVSPSVAHADPSVPQDDEARLRRVFVYEGDTLKLKESRIKAETKGDFVARLSCLFLYAHELAGRTRVLRTDLNELLKKASVYDGNARNWIANTTDLMSDDGEWVSLSVPGTERAIDTLNRIDDTSIIGSFVLGAKTRPRSTKPGVQKKSEADMREGASKSSRTGRSLESKKVSPWVEKWKEAAIAVNAYTVLEDKSTAEKGLFGLWAIRKALGDSGKVITRVQLAQFLYQTFEIMINDATLGKSLKARAMNEKVINTEGTRFQITPSGIAHVEQMLGLHTYPPLTSISTNGSSPSIG